MIASICHEMELRSAEIQDQAIETIYLGGGTPSLLGNDQITRLFSTITRLFGIHEKAEITLEANPDDITASNLSFWKSVGINRLSIGIQSFHDNDLHYLNRAHTAQTALDCIKLSREYGFPDLTIDLIYGIPTLSNVQWLQNLNTFAELRLPHLSAYALTVEPRTPLFNLIEEGQLTPVDEKQSGEQFEMLMQFAQEHGYLHYEISNFCLPGHFARHNLSYWKGIEYYGFGPSAHSFNGNIRQWNVSSVSEYITTLTKNELPNEKEELSTHDRYNEYVMTGLRTMWGCDSRDIEKQFGEEYSNYFITNAQKWLTQSLMEQEDKIYKLTNRGKLLADGIAADLFWV